VAVALALGFVALALALGIMALVLTLVALLTSLLPRAGSGVDSIFDFGAIYIFACLYLVFPHLCFFHLSLAYLLPYLSFPLRIDPLHF